MSTSEMDLFMQVTMTAEQIPKNFTSPDDDWVPVVCLENGEGDRYVVDVAAYMASETSKDLLANLIIPAAIKNFKATTCVMVMSVWAGSPMPPGVDWRDRPRPSEDLNREERLMLVEYTAEGVQRFTMAEIIRHEASPPTLGEWTTLKATLADEGRFVGPIVEAMQAV